MYRTCPEDAITFLSEDDFRAHLVDHHRISLSEDSLIAKTCRRVVVSRPDANIDCPICLFSIPNRRSKIGRHLGRHMEDIALPIISLVVPTDEDTDASDKSDEETNSDNEDPQLYPIIATPSPTISPEMTPQPLPGCTPSLAREMLSNGAHERRKPKIPTSQGNRELINYLGSSRPEGAEEGGLGPADSSPEAEEAPVGTPSGIHKFDPDDPFWNPTSTPIDPFRAPGPGSQLVTSERSLTPDVAYPPESVFWKEPESLSSSTFRPGSPGPTIPHYQTSFASQ
jgi:hypothetical protein